MIGSSSWRAASCAEGSPPPLRRRSRPSPKRPEERGRLAEPEEESHFARRQASIREEQLRAFAPHRGDDRSERRTFRREAPLHRARRHRETLGDGPLLRLAAG
jgi:hypothetical protein